MSIFSAGTEASAQRLQESLAESEQEALASASEAQIAAGEWLADQQNAIIAELVEKVDRLTALFDRLFGLDEGQSQTAGDEEPLPSLFRTGDIIMTQWPQNPPKGWLACDGTEKSKRDYENLYKTLGHRYGQPTDGDKFRLPNLAAPDLVYGGWIIRT
jgi:hypothetical protein